MNGKRIQFNGRSAISFLLAVLILTAAVTPALAEEDEGGGYRSARGQAVVVDDEMGFVSLKLARPTAVTVGSVVFASVDDEGMGYLSLKESCHIGTQARQSSLAIADDQAMGYLSLKAICQIRATSGSQALTWAQ